MPTFKWPPELPQTSLLSDYNETIPDGRTRSSVTTGVGKVRSFWTGVRKTSVAMNMTEWQWGLVNKIWREDLKRGTKVFWMPLASIDNQPLDDGRGIPLLTGAGAPLTVACYMLCRFGDSPPAITAVYRSDLFKVSFPIDVLP